MSKFQVGDKVYRPSDPILKRQYEVIETGHVLVKRDGIAWQLSERHLELVPETVTLTIELPKEVVELLTKCYPWSRAVRVDEVLDAIVEAAGKVAK